MTAVTYWLGALGLLALIIALHPFLTYPLSLALFAKRTPLEPAAPNPSAKRPTLALCTCAYNEERVIVAKVESLLAMQAAYGPATIHVYVDGTSDSTAELLAPYADRIDLVVSPQRQGKTAGLNLLVARSESELIAFTDANVVAPADGLIELTAPFSQASIGCTSARLVYSNEDESATSSAGSAYWKIEESLKRIESETVGVIGVDGAFFVLRRALYEPAPPHLIDDLYVTLLILARGFKVLTVEHVVVEERSATLWHEEFRRKRRIACQALNVHRALWPRLRKMPSMTLYAYLSHRWIKWMMPFTLVASGAFFAAALASMIGGLPTILLIVLGSALLAGGALIRFKPATMILTALASLAGVGAGIMKSVFQRETYTVWAPAESVRG
ncbi:glycosyltransferase [Sphingomonas sp. PP-CC-3A-396]|uniref:glycosyltransferase n=1 Tax=Sphingomonas sp. PP-CC-3A-396 TaxID=2135655 RepID=UPI001046FFA8|nr:glycosyltransferase [Sphingomonas sp. PP-CC-3A-396]TCQ03020.1 cellulose synthase/poly-beta-1,6-N-acetylglucosamine synthase-like glycosyltransferase [Sphingomonas sp. PP-CC-3A-396]